MLCRDFCVLKQQFLLTYEAIILTPFLTTADTVIEQDEGCYVRNQLPLCS